MGQLNVVSQIKKYGTVKAVSNGDGGYSLQLANGDTLQNVSPVFALPGITIPGVPELPAANAFENGANVRLHKDNFVGAGANALGAKIEADALNNIWRPAGPQRLFRRQGNLGAPIATLTAADKFNIGVDPIIPAGLLTADSKLIFKFKYRKLGATAPIVRVNFGTDMSVRTNNSLAYTQTVSGTANRDVSVYSEFEFITTGAAFVSNRSQLGGGGTDSQFLDASTLLNVAAAMKATFEASTLSGDTVYLLGFEIIWEH